MIGNLERRAMILQTASAGFGASLLGAMTMADPNVSLTPQSAPLKGRLKQSAERWCYRNIPIEDLAREAAAIGLKGIDLIEPKDWPAVKKYGLVPTMVSGGGTIADGLNRKENHDKLEREFRENIPRAAEAGAPNVIAFSRPGAGAAKVAPRSRATLRLVKTRLSTKDRRYS